MIATTGTTTLNFSPKTARATCGRLRQTPDGRQTACKRRATWRVGLRLRSDEYSEPFDYFFEQLKVCNRCRTKITVQDVLTPATLTHVSQKLVAWHRPPPKKKLTTLLFQHLMLDFVAGG